MPISSFLHKHEWLLLITGVLLIATQRAVSQSLPPVEQLVSELPPCSVLRAELEHGRHGDGVTHPYVERMQQLGVQRAELELHAILRGNHPAKIQVVRRLYFRRFDAPNSQISDETNLKAIEKGLQLDLDDIARDRASRARTFKFADPHLWPLKRVTSYVEILANAWLPEREALWVPSGRSDDALNLAVIHSDAAETRVLLESHRFGTAKLNQALFDAALSRYDNSAVIALLLKAGADPNARTTDGSTPLVNAIRRPCNLRPLLEGGANPNARDKWGGTALDSARRHKNAVAIRLLQDAGAN